MAEMTEYEKEVERGKAIIDGLQSGIAPGERAMAAAFAALRNRQDWIHTLERAPGPQDADNAGKVRAINVWMDEEEDGQVNNTLVTVRWEVVKSHPDRYVVWHALLRMPDEPVLPGVV